MKMKMKNPFKGHEDDTFMTLVAEKTKVEMKFSHLQPKPQHSK